MDQFYGKKKSVSLSFEEIIGNKKERKKEKFKDEKK